MSGKKTNQVQQACVPKCEICDEAIVSPPDALMGWDGMRPIYLCEEHIGVYEGRGFSVCVDCRRRTVNDDVLFRAEGGYCKACAERRGLK